MKAAMMGFLAFGANLIGIGSTLVMLVMLMAGGANSTDAQISRIKWMMLSIAIVALFSVAASIWAMVAGRLGIAAAVGIIPAVYCTVLVVALLRIEA